MGSLGLDFYQGASNSGNLDVVAVRSTTVPLSVQGGRASGRVFPRLSHMAQRRGERVKNKDDNNTSDAAAILSAAPLSV